MARSVLRSVSRWWADRGDRPGATPRVSERAQQPVRTGVCSALRCGHPDPSCRELTAAPITRDRSMPTRRIPNTDVKYELLIYDAHGTERQEADGTLLSERVCAAAAAAAPPITDVFLSSHGWKGDVPAAIDQYDRWIGEVARLEADRTMARTRYPGFNPLIIGL